MVPSGEKAARNQFYKPQWLSPFKKQQKQSNLSQQFKEQTSEASDGQEQMILAAAQWYLPAASQPCMPTAFPRPQLLPTGHHSCQYFSPDLTVWNAVPEQAPAKWLELMVGAIPARLQILPAKEGGRKERAENRDRASKPPPPHKSKTIPCHCSISLNRFQEESTYFKSQTWKQLLEM